MATPLMCSALTTVLCCVPQVMNVDGMTRENVASHLQKYRLYLKRLAGVPGTNPIPQHLLDTVRHLRVHHPPPRSAACAVLVLVLACVLGPSPFGTPGCFAWCLPCKRRRSRAALAGAGVQAVGQLLWQP